MKFSRKRFIIRYHVNKLPAYDNTCMQRLTDSRTDQTRNVCSRYWVSASKSIKKQSARPWSQSDGWGTSSLSWKEFVEGLKLTYLRKRVIADKVWCHHHHHHHHQSSSTLLHEADRLWLTLNHNLCLSSVILFICTPAPSCVNVWNFAPTRLRQRVSGSPLSKGWLSGQGRMSYLRTHQQPRIHTASTRTYELITSLNIFKY